MAGAKCANSRTQFSSVDDLRDRRQSLRIMHLEDYRHLRNNNEMRPLFSAIPEVSKETDNLDSFPQTLSRSEQRLHIRIEKRTHLISQYATSPFLI